jgi:hypothetical protein
MKLSFWMAFLIPWLLDLLGGQGVLLSLFGSTLWGLSLGVLLVGESSRDLGFRNKCYLVASGVASCWLIYWVCAFFIPSTSLIEEHPLWIKIFIVFNAGLLSSALGLVAILALTSVIWIFSELGLRKTSWERRAKLWFKFPSLESLARGAQGSIQMAFRFWGMGLFLAAVTTYLQSKQVAGPSGEAKVYAWQWLSDIRVWFTAFLWGLLFLGLKIENLFPFQKRWRYRGYLVFSIFFITLFLTFMSFKDNVMHEPAVWFLR